MMGFWALAFGFVGMVVLTVGKPWLRPLGGLLVALTVLLLGLQLLCGA